MFEPDRPTARFIMADGNTQIVHPNEVYLHEGVFFNSRSKAGQLKCLHCEAPMKISEGFSSVAGSSVPGIQSHFLAATSHEEGCDLAKPSSRRKYQKIDRKKGYAVLMNFQTFSFEFADENGVYDYSEGGRATLKMKDIRDREKYRIHSAADFEKFLKEADPKRFPDTKFIFANRAYGWDEMVLPYNKPDRYLSFVQKLALPENKELGLPCIMEIRTKNHYADRFSREYWRVSTDRARLDVLGDGVKRIVHRGIEIDFNSEDLVGATLRREGQFMVMAMASLNRSKRPHDTFYVNIRIARMEQIMRFDPVMLSQAIRENMGPKRLRPSAMLPAAE